jgi:hypothetical protein
MNTTPTRQPNGKNGQPALDIHHPFMDDKRHAISAETEAQLCPDRPTDG